MKGRQNLPTLILNMKKKRTAGESHRRFCFMNSFPSLSPGCRDLDFELLYGFSKLVRLTVQLIDAGEEGLHFLTLGD